MASRSRKYNETDQESEIKPDKVTVYIAIVLCVSFGFLLTYGDFRWIGSELRDFSNITYAGHGMLCFVIFLVSELWALFIQIPSINGYNKIVARWVNVLRIILGVLFLSILILFTTVFFVGPCKNGFRLWLTKIVYNISG